ncbi:MobF family relaxase [Mycobacterium branderi]|uniref:AAA family ATPase n=1 Tax=Mycobacterium branderi TaxID=43348 RepID=A0A7I7WCT1_9MYCO|nr:MobF family relaxase [Mycobacterium branderi]MCV7234569.1 relaxase domain-containing protein [Mycobacterium branderi]ORA33121.1 AAA family ATPase [Mycobacterium branderi]BBZ15356.1 TraA/ATP-dependent exoDNAse/relaxase [Mycobacterium branderi]
MLTISRLSRWSIDYYNDTANKAKQAAMDRHRANGGLGEYYTEGDTRAPTWVITGDTAAVGRLTGLDGAALDGGFADTETAARWLDDGIAPNGATGRAFTEKSVHGFDLVFAAPKSVSLIRALTDDVAEKVVANAHIKAVQAALTYLHAHAGYTRVHNPLTGTKDLERLPGLVAIAYQHETSRCGDPHLHTHVILPNRQPRADGKLVSIDSKSLHHEAKAAGIIYQAVLRHELHAERGFEWTGVEAHSGMAEIAGVDRDSIKVWSQRSTRLREWAKDNLVIVDGQPTAAQLAAAQKATRPAKPESLAWEELKEMWRADERGLTLVRDAHFAARDERRRAARRPLDRARVAQMAAHIDKAAFTRADMVEIVGAQLPVDAPGDPRALIEAIVDEVSVRVSAKREAQHREGHEKFTVDAVIAEEERVFEMVDDSDARSRLDVRAEDLGDLSPDQERAIRSIAVSPFLVQPLQAPAGAGKTHSLRALRAAARRARKEVLVLAPTGKAVDEAMQEGAGDRGLTVAKALKLIEDDELDVDRSTVIVVDEASMVGTPALKKLLSCAAIGRAKMVLVGDAYQLSPVRARGGMFEHLCADLPWSQRLSEVWRMSNPEERDASLALRSAHGNRLRKAVGWYRTHGRLHTGDPIAMAADARDAYLADRAAGKDALLICDTWEMADALNHRLHDALTGPGPSVRCARDQTIRVGDIIMSRNNDATIVVQPGARHRRADRIDQVRNGNRWLVAAVDAKTNRVAAERTSDKARVVFEGDYLREHVTLGYAATVHSAQGVTADTAYTILGEGSTRAMLYVAMTRGRHNNEAFIYQRITGEAEHEHSTPVAGADIHILRRGNKYSAAHYFRMILANDDRPRTMHAEADRTERGLLPEVVANLLKRQDQRSAARTAVWREHTAAERDRQAAYQRMAGTTTREQSARDQGVQLDDGLEL